MGANIGNFRHAWVPQLPPGVGPISGIGSPRFSAGRQPRRDPEPQAELRADASFHQKGDPFSLGPRRFFGPGGDRLGWDAAKDRIPLVELKSREFRD